MRPTDGASYFADEVNPTANELRAWAWSGASAPWEDFHMVLDSEDVLPVVIQCAEDPGCPTRALLLESLYCTVGHLQPSDRARVGAVAADAETSPDPAVRTWLGERPLSSSASSRWTAPSGVGGPPWPSPIPSSRNPRGEDPALVNHDPASGDAPMTIGDWAARGPMVEPL